jgi:cytoplasmic iron level regulating protein YaaA (DUF328/UPF0246 family)
MSQVSNNKDTEGETMTKKKRPSTNILDSGGGSGDGKRKKNATAVDAEKDTAGSTVQAAGGTQRPPYKLIAIVSPAKSLKIADKLTDEEEIIPHEEWTTPSCVSTTQHHSVVKAMKGHAKEGTAKLSKLLGVSNTIAQTAHTYWTSFDVNADNGSIGNDGEFVRKPCGYSFDGVVYQGLDFMSLIEVKDTNNNSHSSSSSSDSKKNGDKLSSFPAIAYLQEHLRIVDPVYGWLRPMDVMQPYRIEMSTKNVLSGSDKSTKLATFWKPAIRDCLESEEASLAAGQQRLVILNLASDEYSSAVDWPRHKVIKVVFRHGGRVIAVHAKRARGLMAKYLALKTIQSLASLQNFDLEGYTFRPDQSSPSLSTINNDDSWIGAEGSDPICLVYDRPVDWDSKTGKTKEKR